jgi:hypothetical protein
MLDNDIFFKQFVELDDKVYSVCENLSNLRYLRAFGQIIPNHIQYLYGSIFYQK